MKVSLDIPAGIVSDETTFSMPGHWSDGSNVRGWRGRMQVVGGWSTAFTGLSGVCRNVAAYSDTNYNLRIVLGTHTNLYVYSGGTLYDITPSGLGSGAIDSAAGPGFGVGGYSSGSYGSSSAADFYARTWCLQTWGSYMLANPRGGSLYVWQNNTASLATIISQAPANSTAILVTPERQVLAFGCNEELSGTVNTMCIRGCDLEDYTNWTSAADNNAFEHILSGGGRIVTAKMLGQYVAVWTDTGVHLGQFIGDPSQTYRFDLVASNCGLAGPNAVTVLNQTAYWITPSGQFYRWQVGAPPEMMVCTLRKDFADNLVTGQLDKVVACPITQYGEVWWFYPDARDGTENSRYVAVSTIDGGWFRGDLARTAAMDASPTDYPLFVTYGGTAYWHENGQSADGSALSWDLTSTDMYLSDAERRVLVRGIWPDFEGLVGPVSVSFTMKDYPQSTGTTKGPWAVGSTTEKKDFLAEGRIGKLVLSGSSAPSYMRLGRPQIDVVVTGGY